MIGKAAGEKENKSENLPLFIDKTLRVKVFDYLIVTSYK